MSNVLPFRRASVDSPPRAGRKFYELGDDALSVGGQPPRRGDICRVAVGEVRPGDLHVLVTPGGRILCGVLSLQGNKSTLTFPNKDLPPYTGSAEIVGRVEHFYCKAETEDGRVYVSAEREFLTISDETPGEVCVYASDDVEVVNWRRSASGQTLYISESWFRLAECVSIEQLNGAGYLAYVHPDDRDAAREVIARSLAAGVPWTHGYRLALRGSHRRARAVAAPCRNPESGATEWHGSIRIFGRVCLADPQNREPCVHEGLNDCGRHAVILSGRGGGTG